MTQPEGIPLDYRPPTPTPPSLRWLILLFVWLIGLAVWVVYFCVIGYVLLRYVM